MKELKIGNQIWSSENLSTTKFNNGEDIPLIDPKSFNQEWRFRSKWEKTGDKQLPLCCYYKDESERENYEGVLYNWHAIMDSREICPEGWRIPTIEDYEELALNVGGVKEIENDKWNGEIIRYKNFLSKLKSEKDWDTDIVGDNSFSNGTNDYEFNLKPYGQLSSVGNWLPQFKKTTTKLWTVSENLDGYKNATVFVPYFHEDGMVVLKSNKTCGIQVRCIKN